MDERIHGSAERRRELEPSSKRRIHVLQTRHSEASYKPTLFAVQPCINAQDALTYVSNLLETAIGRRLATARG